MSAASTGAPAEFARENERLQAQVAELTAQVAQLTAELERCRQQPQNGGAAEPPPGEDCATAADAEAIEAQFAAHWMTEPTTEPLCTEPQPELTLRDGHDAKNVLCVAWAPMSPRLLASGGVDKMVKVFAVAAPSAAAEAEIGRASALASFDCPAPPLALAWRSWSRRGDGVGLLAVSCMDGSVHVVMSTVRRGQGDEAPTVHLDALTSLRPHGKYVEACRWSARGNYLATGSSDKTVKLWQLEDRTGLLREVNTWFLSGCIEAVEFLCPPDSATTTLVAAPKEYHAMVHIDCATLATREVSLNRLAWDKHVSFSVCDLRASPDQRFLLAATDHNRHIVYPAGSNVHARILVGHAADEYAKPRVAWSPDGSHVFSNSHQEHVIYVWSLASQRIVGRLAAHGGVVRDLAHHPTHPVLASASYDHDTRLWGPGPAPSAGDVPPPPAASTDVA